MSFNKSTKKAKTDEEYIRIFMEFKSGADFSEVGKILGRGAFGQVREIKYPKKIMAGKLIKRAKEDEPTEEEKIASELRGENIIRISKIISKRIKNELYDLIIMEKAVLRDLGKLNDFYHGHNLLKLIHFPFVERTGELLLKFYIKQIINALELLYRSDYVHFDIKPENLLITINLIIKISDFSLIRKVKGGINKIPGGTHGYLTPEYYSDKRYLSSEEARKQDYFALGAVIFILLFGEKLIKYKIYEGNKTLNADKIIEILQKQVTAIKSRKSIDKDLIKFLCGLIQYKPQYRLSFEQIFRNKWVNKNQNVIKHIWNSFQNDEEKIIMELQKFDFLIKKKIHEYFKKEDDKNLKNNEKNEVELVRFRYKKKLSK